MRGKRENFFLRKKNFSRSPRTPLTLSRKTIYFLLPLVGPYDGQRNTLLPLVGPYDGQRNTLLPLVAGGMMECFDPSFVRYHLRLFLFGMALFLVWVDNLRQGAVPVKKKTPLFLKRDGVFPLPKNHLPLSETEPLELPLCFFMPVVVY